VRVDARGRKIEPQKPWELHRALAEWNILTGHIMPLLTCHAHDDPEVGSFAVARCFCARCAVCAGPALRGFCAREPTSPLVLHGVDGRESCERICARGPAAAVKCAEHVGI